MLKINIKPKVLYWTTIAMFIAIICFFTAIYPLSLDEYRISSISFPETFSNLKTVLTLDCARFPMIFYVLFTRFMDIWKICFSIINPFIQLLIIFGMFFVVTGRKVNFKDTKDFYLFLLLILMYLLMVPSPSNTLFWMSGTMVYSWGFVPPLILLCLFRQTIDGKELKSSIGIKVLMLIISFAAGMSNENTGPMMIGLTVLFLIYCKFKKIRIPDFYYYVLSGTFMGVFMMFATGAGIQRLYTYTSLYKWNHLPFSDKILVFLWHFNRFLNALFWLPIVNLIGLLLILYDKKKLIIKDKDFILSSLFCLCGFLLTLALVMAPYVQLRTHYSSAVFFFISFAMMILVIQKFYHVNLIKYLTLTMFIVGIVISPFIALPYIHLYKQNHNRDKIIAQARKEGKQGVFVNRLTVLKGPTDNWSIQYYDILWDWNFSRLERKYKIQLYYEIISPDHTYTDPL